MQKLAIFGGTFNPIHWGHLLIAEAAFDQLQLDRVFWIPAYHPPHKEGTEALISYEHRLEMVQQAVIDHPNFEVSTIERERVGVSYAVDTLRALQKRYSNSENTAQWYWIVGLDAFRAFPRWYAHQELAANCIWLVAPRSTQSSIDPPDSIGAEVAIGAEVVEGLASRSIKIQWQVLQMPSIEISSSLIRAYCHQQRSIRYLVPEPVRRYILTHGLYR